MAAQSTKVLKMLQDRAVKEVEVAQEALANALKAVDEAKSKETLLMDYRQDYSNKLTKSLEGGLNIESYKNTQNFLIKLDEAVNSQASMIRMLNEELLVKQQLLQACQKRKLSYDILIERAGKRVQKAELKRDQKMMDEFAMRASRIKP